MPVSAGATKSDRQVLARPSRLLSCWRRPKKVASFSDRLSPVNQRWLLKLSDALMIITCLVIFRASYNLCEAMWVQTLASLPVVTYGEMYLPIPIGAMRPPRASSQANGRASARK